MSSERARRALAGLLLIGAMAAQEPAERLSPAEAMQACCEDAVVTRRLIALDAEQRAAAAKASGDDALSATAQCFEARRAGRVVAIGYLDVHLVRTKKQMLLVVVDNDGDGAGTVRRVEVLRFAEPCRYRPAGSFYQQFVGQRLDDDLREGRKIHRVTGATLTTRATTAAVRRALAVHAVTHPPATQ